MRQTHREQTSQTTLPTAGIDVPLAMGYSDRIADPPNVQWTDVTPMCTYRRNAVALAGNSSVGAQSGGATRTAGWAHSFRQLGSRISSHNVMQPPGTPVSYAI